MSNVRLAWTWPTQRVLGEALPETQIQHLEIDMSADGGENFSGLVQASPPDIEHFIADIAPGTYIFRGVVVDTEGRHSDVTEVTSEPVLSAPEALADFTVTIE